VPSKLEDEYQVKVKMEAGPFRIDASQPSLIKAAALRERNR
jgi:hypothetical protein